MYDINVDIEELENIENELSKILERLSDSESALKRIYHERRYEIWCSEPAEEYWEIIKRQYMQINKNYNQVLSLADQIGVYISNLREIEQQAYKIVETLD